MWVNADCCVERRMLLGQPETGFQIGRTVARPDGQHVLYAGSHGPLDHCIAILIEIGAVKVAMRIDHMHSRGARTLACRVATRGDARYSLTKKCSQECEHGTQECVRHKLTSSGRPPEHLREIPPAPACRLRA